jgi:hypothetical protein
MLRHWHAFCTLLLLNVVGTYSEKIQTKEICDGSHSQDRGVLIFDLTVQGEGRGEEGDIEAALLVAHEMADGRKSAKGQMNVSTFCRHFAFTAVCLWLAINIH